MKKTLAIFLCLIFVLSSVPTALASSVEFDNLRKNFDIGTNVPVTSGTSATFEKITDGAETVWKVTTKKVDRDADYNIFFNNSSSGYTAAAPFVISYDVNIKSVDESFDLDFPVFNPHLQYNASPYFLEPKLPSAYCDESGNVTFKASAATDTNAGFTNIGTFQGNINKWYTVKLCFAPGGTLKTYVIDRENGNSAAISQITYSDEITQINKLNLTSRGNAEYLFDNLKVYQGGSNTSSYNVNYFDTKNGLNLTVSLSPDVKKAELKANGAVIETIENAGAGIFRVSNNTISSAVKEYKLEMVCYDGANNVIDTVTETIKPEVIVSNTLKSESVGSETSIASGTNILTLERKYASVIETQYDILIASGTSSFNQNSKHFTSTGGNGWGVGVSICKSGALNLETSGLPLKAYKSDVWYTVRTVYDSKNSVVKAYVNDGNGELLSYSGVLDKNGNGIGYYLTQLNGQAAGTKYRNAYVKDILTVNGTEAVSYVNYIGKALAIGEAIPASAKGVNINLGDLTLSSLDGVKLYKDGVEVTGTNKNVSGNVLTVAPTAFEAGNYKVSISGTTYNGNATNLVFEEEFKVINEFAVLSPENGEKLSADKLSIAVSTLNCEKLEIYANDVLKDTANNPETIYVYEYTPESFGTLKIDAVATMSDGSKETDTVFTEIEGTVLTYDSDRNFGYSGSAFASGGNGTYNDTATVYYTTSKTEALGKRDSGNFTVTTVSGATTDAASKTNGIVHLKHYIKIDDVSAHLLVSEGKSFNSSGGSVFAPYPMNSSNASRNIFNYGTITKEPSSMGSYSYSDGKWYEIEYVIDMKGKQQWAYIKDMETGAVETLADGITADIADGYGFYQLKYEMNKGATTGTVGITLSSVDVKNYEKIPTMGNITYSGTISTNGMIEPCSSIEIALDGTGFDGDISQYITLTKNGETANAEISYADGKITVTPEGGFQKNNRYKVTISGDATVKSKKINIPVSKEITVAEGGLYISPLKIVKGDTAGTYKAELNYYNYGETTEDGILVLASYSGNKMNKIALSLKNKFTKGYGMLNAEITGVTSGETVKAMLWNNTSVLSPMIGSLDITAE